MNEICHCSSYVVPSAANRCTDVLCDISAKVSQTLVIFHEQYVNFMVHIYWVVKFLLYQWY